MQVVGVAIIGLWTVTATVAVFYVLQGTLGLRVDSESEEVGLDQTEHNIVAYPNFVTDGGVATDTGSTSHGPSSQGTQEADAPTMWRGEEVAATDSAGGILQGTGIDSFPDPTLVVDASDEITALNPHAVRFFETTEAEALEEPPTALVDRSEDSLDATAEIVETGREIRDRRGTVTVGGERVPVSVTATPLHEDGELVGALATVRNAADEVAATRHRQTVEEYREAGIENQREKLAALSEGDLNLERGIPDPPDDHPDLEALSEVFREIDGYIVEVADSVEAIVERVPEQSEHLAESSTSLSESSEDIATSIEDISDLAGEIDSRVGALSAETEQAGESVGDLSAAIEEITASTSEISATSDRATDLTRECVDEMVETVDHIRAAADRTTRASEAIDELEADMAEVGEIVDIIRDIAKQTNMLALNASIEAANADADGEGFAVVADEVKALAEDAKSSADDIASIIDSAGEQTEAVASAMDETSEEITAGADIVESTAEDLRTVRERIEETNAGVGEISDAVERQADQTQQVSAAMDEIGTEMDAVGSLTADINANVDAERSEIANLTDLADRLRDIATEMHGNIDRFDLRRDLTSAAATD